jgi:hypothetical protein
MKKKISSFYDKKGKLYVDCAECIWGGNSKDDNKCSAGGHIKKTKKAGCFIGGLDEDILLQLQENCKEGK